MTEKLPFIVDHPHSLIRFCTLWVDVETLIVDESRTTGEDGEDKGYETGARACRNPMKRIVHVLLILLDKCGGVEYRKRVVE